MRTPKMKKSDIAKICHEANRAYCETQGDHSQPAWNVAPKWQTDSAVQGVQAILDNPTITPAQIHEEWMKAKEADGWVYGDVKDSEKKTHPCMVPYYDLPESQRQKDDLFGSIVMALSE